MFLFGKYGKILAGFLIVFAAAFFLGGFLEKKIGNRQIIEEDKSSQSIFSRAATLINAAFFKDTEPEITLSLKDDNPVMDFSLEGGSVSAVGTRCSFDSPSSIKKDNSPVIISEVAWMGDKNSANNEWLEVQNVSEKGADLSGFEILNENGNVKIRFPKNFHLPAASFALLKRGSGAAPEKKSDLIYSGAIRNSKEGLRFLDSSCALLDEVFGNPAWPAGENATKKTMERRKDRSWQTSAVLGGTPKAENSVLKVVKNNKDEIKKEDVSAQKELKTEKITEQDEKEDESFSVENTLTGATSTSVESKTDKDGEKKSADRPSAAVKECRFETNAAPSYDGVFINEVAWMGTALNANDEWFEIWNSTGAEKNIAGWQITDKNEDIKIVFDAKAVIPPYGFLLFERTDDSSLPNEPADIIYTGALSNENEGLRLFDVNCNLKDQALGLPNWPAGENASKKTMERRKDRSWQTSAASGGTPKRESSAIIVFGGGGNASPSPPPLPNPQTGIPPIFSITEIMYDLSGSDSDREWFETRNDGAEAADLAELKFFEDGINHTINFFSGASQVLSGGYAVVAKKPEKFLEDHPDYSGSLFSASFSFNNSGETIALKFGDFLVDEVSYTSQNGGAGDGNSLQKIGGVWQGALPTPGRENVFTVSGLDDLEESASSLSVSTTTATSSDPETPEITGATGSPFSSVILISEIQTGGTDAGDEFIELYNPSDKLVNLSGWSLQYLSGTATSAEKISKKNFEEGSIIPAGGFFLIARGMKDDGSDGYKGSVLPDLTHRSFSLSGSAPGGVVFLAASTTKILSYNDGIISDFVAYGNPAFISSTAPISKKSESIERIAALEGVCVSAHGANEFLGNGCVKDETTPAEVFLVRLSPRAQNSKGLPEPRLPPVAPAPSPFASSVIAYNSETGEIVFKWAPSSDALGATSSVYYEILDSSSSIIFEGTSTTFTVEPDEAGKEYQFSIRAFDFDGMGSPTSALSVFAPFPFEINTELNASTSILRIFWNDEMPTSTIYEIAVTTSTEIADSDWQEVGGSDGKEFIFEPDIAYEYLIAVRRLDENRDPLPFVKIVWKAPDE